MLSNLSVCVDTDRSLRQGGGRCCSGCGGGEPAGNPPLGGGQQGPARGRRSQRGSARLGPGPWDVRDHVRNRALRRSLSSTGLLICTPIGMADPGIHGHMLHFGVRALSGRGRSAHTLSAQLAHLSKYGAALDVAGQPAAALTWGSIITGNVVGAGHPAARSASGAWGAAAKLRRPRRSVGHPDRNGACGGSSKRVTTRTRCQQRGSHATLCARTLALVPLEFFFNSGATPRRLRGKRDDDAESFRLPRTHPSLGPRANQGCIDPPRRRPSFGSEEEGPTSDDPRSVERRRQQRTLAFGAPTKGHAMMTWNFAGWPAGATCTH